MGVSAILCNSHKHPWACRGELCLFKSKIWYFSHRRSYYLKMPLPPRSAWWITSAPITTASPAGEMGSVARRKQKQSAGSPAPRQQAATMRNRTLSVHLIPALLEPTGRSPEDCRGSWVRKLAHPCLCSCNFRTLSSANICQWKLDISLQPSHQHTQQNMHHFTITLMQAKEVFTGAGDSRCFPVPQKAVTARGICSPELPAFLKAGEFCAQITGKGTPLLCFHSH